MVITWSFSKIVCYVIRNIPVCWAAAVRVCEYKILSTIIYQSTIAHVNHKYINISI